MIATTEELADAITGSFTSTYVADVVVDGVVVLQDLPLVDAQLEADGDAEVITSGTATVLWSDVQGSSIIPERLTDWFTPYATYLDISYRVGLGAFSEKVLRGRLKIVGVSEPEEVRRVVAGRDVSVVSSLRLTLRDLFHVYNTARFSTPEAPAAGATVWGEIARLTGLPVTVTIPDKTITRTVTYADSYLDAVFDLAAILEGSPYMAPDGSVAMLGPAGAPVAVLDIGAQGTVVRADPDDMTDEGIYNAVVVRASDDQQATVLAERRITDGPLRWDGPMFRRPYFAASQFITTQAQAAAYAESLLPKVSTAKALRFTIQHVPDPRLEVGDVVSFPYRGNLLEGRIRKLTMPGLGLWTTTVEVSR